MGYARTVPFQLLRFSSRNTAGANLTTVASSFTLGSFTTPIWTGTPTYAYVDLLIYTWENTNVAQNNTRNTSGMDMALTPDLISYQTCGAWDDAELITKLSTYGCGSYRVPGTTNLNTYLQPNTLYYVELRNAKSASNVLWLYNTAIELNMIFMD